MATAAEQLQHRSLLKYPTIWLQTWLECSSDDTFIKQQNFSENENLIEPELYMKDQYIVFLKIFIFFVWKKFKIPNSEGQSFEIGLNGKSNTFAQKLKLNLYMNSHWIVQIKKKLLCGLEILDGSHHGK